MSWVVCFWSAIIVLTIAVIAAVVLRKVRYKRGRLLTSFNIIFAGVVISSLLLFIPIYSVVFENGNFRVGKVLLLSLHNTIRLFLVDGEFSIITDYAQYIQSGIAEEYMMLAAILFVVAPVLTFGVVLSFFKNISAYKDYIVRYFRDAYIFSELNEHTLALAASLKKNNKERMIVFTDIFENQDEEQYELTQRAYELGCVLFKKDIADINFGIHSQKKEITFFISGRNDDENVKQTFILIDKYKHRENVSMYVSSTSVNSELLLNTVDKGKIKLRRLNEVQSLISRLLYDDGSRIFGSAYPEETGERLIHAVILGLGQHGTEMVKALSWFCQMDGYRIVIDAFDSDKNAESKFCSLCPELMDEKHNGDFKTKGEAHYQINIHSGIDITTKVFWNLLHEMVPVTYVFVALGDDEENIKAAVKVRSWLMKKGNGPTIDAVVYNTDKKHALEGITNYSGQKYDINFVGDVESSYSEKVIMESDIEAVALKRHLRWGKEEEFWKYEYNYRSSIASAIHRKMKIECGIKDAEKEPEERSEEAKWALRDLEHRRWNAYMRSEGFTYGPVRNNLAKVHHCLVPFDELPLKEQEKDDD